MLRDKKPLCPKALIIYLNNTGTGMGHIKVKSLFSFLFILLGIWGFSHSRTDKYRTVFAGNPSSEITIAWNQLDGEKPIVYYGLEDFGQDTSKYEHKLIPQHSNSHKEMNNHFARLNNLADGQVYYFVIADNNSLSPRFKFRTIAQYPKELSVVHGGDSRSNRTGRISVNKMVKKFRPHFVAFGGDFINVSDPLSWQYWLEDWQHTIGEDGLIIPLIPTRGNHETDEDVHKLFDTPTPDNVYPINIGENFLKLWVLNSEKGNYAEQAKALKEDMAQKDFQWKMAHWHSPISPIGPKSFMHGMYDNWSRLIYDLGFHIAGESHSHVVKRSYPIKPSAVSPGKYTRDDEWGTIYIGEGCWGVPLRTVQNIYDWVQGYGAFHEFNWLQFSPEKINLLTIMVPENSDSIPYISYDAPFTLPNGAKIWQPQKGDAITRIYPRKKAIKGCTKEKSKNYNPEANMDDGSCFFDQPDFKFKGKKEFFSNIVGDSEFPVLEIHLKNKENFLLKVSDKRGQLIFSKKISPEFFQLRVPLNKGTKLQHGIYYVSIEQQKIFSAQSVVHLPF